MEHHLRDRGEIDRPREKERVELDQGIVDSSFTDANTEQRRIKATDHTP
jgi:hypothetical protein